jgi:hypothetical protein
MMHPPSIGSVDQILFLALMAEIVIIFSSHFIRMLDYSHCTCHAVSPLICLDHIHSHPCDHHCFRILTVKNVSFKPYLIHLLFNMATVFTIVSLSLMNVLSDTFTVQLFVIFPHMQRIACNWCRIVISVTKWTSEQSEGAVNLWYNILSRMDFWKYVFICACKEILEICLKNTLFNPSVSVLRLLKISVGLNYKFYTC